MPQGARQALIVSLSAVPQRSGRETRLGSFLAWPCLASRPCLGLDIRRWGDVEAIIRLGPRV
jgi:hypothetical protein